MRFCCLVVLLLGFCCSNSAAQDNSKTAIAGITEKDFDLPASPVLNGSEAAVILSDIGTVSFVGSKDRNWVSYVFVRKTRIKIISKAAFGLAMTKIHLYGLDKLENLTASTYNLENGKVTESKWDSKDKFENKLGPNSSETKFTMPDVKEGSVIEYSYTINSYRFYQVPDWNFQHIGYPCLYSRLEIGIPDLLRYVVMRKGLDPVTMTEGKDERQTLHLLNVNVATAVHKHTWEMRDIAAFKENAFIHAPMDYVDKIEFYLAQTYNGEDIDSRNTWQSANNELLAARGFGHAITMEKATNLYNTAEKITASDKTPMDAAKSIYGYVRDNFSCISDGSIYISNDLYEVNKNRKGSVAELNLLLVALLRQKGLKADPVILSTKDNGTHPADYPLTDKMNYVICLLKMYGENIYLDAAEPRLGFGKLPLNLYNGHGRIISEKDTGNVFFLPESVKELKSTTVFIQNDENGKTMSGNYQSVPGYHQSYQLRNDISKTGPGGYFKDLKGTEGMDIITESEGIDSLKRLEDPVKIHYDFRFKLADGAADILYFTPLVEEAYKENPFAAADRKYPVELPSPIDELYVLNMDIPKGYTVDELPKSAKVLFNENEGFYEYIIQKSEEGIQLRSRIKLNRALYRADEYNALRDFFSFVVKKHAEQIVFKKTK